MLERSDRDDDEQPPDEVLLANAPPVPVDAAGLSSADVAFAMSRAGIERALVELAAIAALDDLEQAAVDAELGTLEEAPVVDRLAGTSARINAVQIEQLRLVARFADLHTAVDRGRLPGAERLVMVGGDGTPLVGDFTAAGLGVALHITTDAAGHLLADVLDLRHRLPALWERLLAGDVPVGIARRVAEESRRLSADATGAVDHRIATIAGSLTWRRLGRIVRAAILAADPESAATGAERAEAEAGVWVDDEDSLRDGYGTLFAKASAGDLAAFNRAVSTVAAALAELGDESPLQQRRARALGILANPRGAADLVEQAKATNRRPGHRHVLDFKHVLYFHLSREAVEAMLADRPSDPGRVEGLGAVVGEQIRRWLGHSSVVVKPVIDPDRMAAVDCWEVPRRISEAVAVTRPADYFPWSTNVSRAQDDEHPVPYVPRSRGGPPGQTSVERLAKITRRHHRVKTFGGWSVTPVRADTWVWRAPTGHLALVDTAGTTWIGRL